MGLKGLYMGFYRGALKAPPWSMSIPEAPYGRVNRIYVFIMLLIILNLHRNIVLCIELICSNFQIKGIPKLQSTQEVIIQHLHLHFTVNNKDPSTMNNFYYKGLQLTKWFMKISPLSVGLICLRSLKSLWYCNSWKPNMVVFFAPCLS